jgi:hypothetical protein
MNKFLLATAASLALAVNQGWSTADTYTIYGNQTVTVPPTVDATNFVNLGVLSIATVYPFDFSNVQNFTNRNYMNNYGGIIGPITPTVGTFSPGFVFDTAPSGAGVRKMARSFYNAPMVPAGIATVYAGTHVVVSATNIVNRGLLEVGTPGLISLEGHKVDIGRSMLQVDRPLLNEGIQDLYRNFGTNRLNPATSFVEATPNGLLGPTTPVYQVIYPPNLTNNTVMSLRDFNFGSSNSVTGTEFTYEGGTNRTVQIVFVRNLNTNITVTVESVGGTPTDIGSITVQWAAAATNTSGQFYQNTIYLTDTYGANPTNVYITNGAVIHPANFDVSRSGFIGFGDTGAPFVNKPVDFWGTPPVITNALYAANGVSISSGTAGPNQSPAMAGGRVEVYAKDTLDMTYSRVEAYGYLKLQSTNHFIGAAAASTAAIQTPYADISLGSTNGQLQVNGLMPDSVSRLSGTIDVYSAYWTNSVVFGGGTNTVLFNVVMVDSFLTDTVAPEIFTLGLRSTNVVISDTLNVTTNLQIQARSLTLQDSGELNLSGAITDWAGSAPGLVALTNLGSIFSLSDLNFTGRNTNGSDRPYSNLHNEGVLEGASISIKAGNIENLGSLFADYGPVGLVATTNAILADAGIISAPFGDITIAAQNLFITNHVLAPGRSITLAVTNNLVAGPNSWTVYDGFNLLVKPTAGDLLNVQVNYFTTDFQETTTYWAGNDFGPVAAGFSNNAALGSLTLDGGLYSLFIFSGVGPSSNALYVDVLYLSNFATNRDSAGNLTSIQVNPGMKIYFSQAYMDDGLGNFVDVTSELAGKNDGAFGQVSHSGPLSVPIPPVTISPAIKVVVEKSPQLRSLVSWQTPAKATNYLYYVANPYSQNWQLLTNFVSGTTSNAVTIVDPGLSSSRFYRVKVDVPAN